MKLKHGITGDTKESTEQVCYCGCRGKKKPFETSTEGRGLFCPSCGRMVLDYYYKVI